MSLQKDPYLSNGDIDIDKVERIQKIFREINTLLDAKRGDECVSALCMALAYCVVSCVEANLTSLSKAEFSNLISELTNNYIKMFTNDPRILAANEE